MLNWQFALVIAQGGPSSRNSPARCNWPGGICALASRIGESMNELFWSQALGLYADDLSQQSFSEHSQSLALPERAWCRRSGGNR